MTKIRFIEHNGTEHVVEGELDNSLMQTARDNLVPGIIGDCGGNACCATCHGYVDPAWLDKLPAQSEEEALMLDGAMHQEPNSRLTCQLKVRPELDGIVIRLPISQI